MSDFIYKTTAETEAPKEADEYHEGFENGIVSILSVVDSAEAKHSGNYTCAPSNARPASVMVHVVDGE